MAAVLVQKASNNSAGAASIAVGSTQGWAAPTAGNLLVAWANCDITMTLTGWTAGPSVVDGNGVYQWYKTAAGTETTVTFTAGGSTSPLTVGVIEYSGTATTPFDVQSSSTVSAVSGTSTTAVSVVATGTSGDLFVAVAGLHQDFAGVAPSGPTWTNGFTNQQTVNSPGVGAGDVFTFVGDFQNTAAATVSTSCSWTTAVGDRQELLIAFKLAAGAAAQIPILVMARST